MTSVPGATTESPDGSVSKLPWKLTVTPLWVRTNGCFAPVPDFTYNWSSSYPDNVQDACQTIVDSLYFLAMKTSPSVLPDEGFTVDARDQWRARVRSAIDGTVPTGIPVDAGSALAAGADHSEAQSMLDPWFQHVFNGTVSRPAAQSDAPVLKTAGEMARSLGIEIQYEDPRPESKIEWDIGEGRRLKVWPGDEENPGVRIVLPDADDTAGTHADPPVIRGAAARTTLSTHQQQNSMATLIDRWSRNEDGMPGAPARVASTAAYLIKAMSAMGFQGVRTRLLPTKMAHDQELKLWVSKMQASKTKEAPSEQ